MVAYLQAQDPSEDVFVRHSLHCQFRNYETTRCHLAILAETFPYAPFADCLYQVLKA